MLAASIAWAVRTVTACADDAWSLPADARFTNVRARIEAGSEKDPLAKFCSDLRLSERQIRTFLKHAGAITPMQFHEFDWLACVVTADVESNSRRATVKISATMVARLDVEGGPQYLLACDGECEKKVQDAR